MMFNDPAGVDIQHALSQIEGLDVEWRDNLGNSPDIVVKLREGITFTYFAPGGKIDGLPVRK